MQVWTCDPIDGSPQGSHIPGILQARTLEWVLTSHWVSQPLKQQQKLSHSISKSSLVHARGKGERVIALESW